jgi:hypothetical protein
MVIRLHNKQSNVPDAVIQNHLQICGRAKSDVDEANGRHRAALKQAKAAGVNQRMLTAVLRDVRKDADVITINLRDYIRYRALMDMPVSQADLFGMLSVPGGVAAASEEIDVSAAFHHGQAAGRTGKARDGNPYDGEARKAFDDGWLSGQREIAAELGEGGVKHASTRRQRRSRGVNGELAVR